MKLTNIKLNDNEKIYERILSDKISLPFEISDFVYLVYPNSTIIKKVEIKHIGVNREISYNTSSSIVSENFIFNNGMFNLSTKVVKTNGNKFVSFEFNDYILAFKTLEDATEFIVSKIENEEEIYTLYLYQYFNQNTKKTVTTNHKLSEESFIVKKNESKFSKYRVSKIILNISKIETKIKYFDNEFQWTNKDNSFDSLLNTQNFIVNSITVEEV